MFGSLSHTGPSCHDPLVTVCSVPWLAGLTTMGRWALAFDPALSDRPDQRTRTPFASVGASLCRVSFRASPRPPDNPSPGVSCAGRGLRRGPSLPTANRRRCDVEGPAQSSRHRSNVLRPRNRRRLHDGNLPRRQIVTPGFGPSSLDFWMLRYLSASPRGVDSAWGSGRAA